MQLHVLHLDVIKSQKLKVKTENFLVYGYNVGTPMAIPIYTVLPYCVISMQIASPFMMPVLQEVKGLTYTSLYFPGGIPVSMQVHCLPGIYTSCDIGMSAL